MPVTRTPELQRWVEQLLEQAAASPVLLDGRQRRDDEVIWRPVEPLVAGRGGGGGCYHISLSRSFPLRFRQIDGFTSNLRETLRELEDEARGGCEWAVKSVAARVKRFQLRLGTLRAFANDDGSRTFLCLCPTARSTERQKSTVSGVDSGEGSGEGPSGEREAAEQEDSSGATKLVALIRTVVDPACVHAAAACATTTRHKYR